MRRKKKERNAERKNTKSGEEEEEGIKAEPPLDIIHMYNDKNNLIEL